MVMSFHEYQSANLPMKLVCLELNPLKTVFFHMLKSSLLQKWVYSYHELLQFKMIKDFEYNNVTYNLFGDILT